MSTTGLRLLWEELYRRNIGRSNYGPRREAYSSSPGSFGDSSRFRLASRSAGRKSTGESHPNARLQVEHKKEASKIEASTEEDESTRIGR
ncbi:Hypothetical protein PHPALM_37907 [Phytophthora palmivora]|uniref:Uncharacterized protein n=1 Tax=Phytophthora palmivora TaxID=4796 RepID=A0A2P4WW85_9STRA|nr:Hypothetical protein PHPALM_37907 [Phytophthora palmivora]